MVDCSLSSFAEEEGPKVKLSKKELKKLKKRVSLPVTITIDSCPYDDYQLFDSCIIVDCWCDRWST